MGKAVRLMRASRGRGRSCDVRFAGLRLRSVARRSILKIVVCAEPSCSAVEECRNRVGPGEHGES